MLAAPTSTLANSRKDKPTQPRRQMEYQAPPIGFVGPVGAGKMGGSIAVRLQQDAQLRQFHLLIRGGNTLIAVETLDVLASGHGLVHLRLSQSICQLLQ